MTIVKKLDDDTDSESEILIPSKKNKIKFGLSLIDQTNCNNYLFPDAKTYRFSKWSIYYKTSCVNLTQLVYNSSWHTFFNNIYNKPYFSTIENKLTQMVKNNQSIVPHPQLLFNSLNIVSLSKIKVVIIGQDPYPSISKSGVPDAIGLSFSVSMNHTKPKSLINVFNNLIKFNHIKTNPETGNLSMWALQGCLLLNTALTTIENNTDSHKCLWNEFILDLLCYINNECENIVFLVWGSNAHRICLNIDPNKHYLITSSHPSPLGYQKTFKGKSYNKDKNKRIDTTYPPFENVDHFGDANKYLKQHKKTGILWDFIL